MEIETKKLIKAVKRVQSGDGKAFETLYNLTSKPAYFTALKIVKSVHDAEDVLQESYIAVLDKINTLESPEAFIGWFNMIVANKAKEFLRKNNKYVFADEDAGEDIDSLALPDSLENNYDEFSPGSGIEQQELKEQVMNLIDGLSDEKRTVVLLYYYNELSIKQIAESLDIKEGTVKSRLYYAKEELARGITEYEKKYGKLLGIAPAAILIWALQTTSVSTSAVFVASGAASATFAAITAHSALAGSAAATGGIAAKVIGYTAVQKAVAAAATMAIVGGAAGTTVAIKNNAKDIPPLLEISETQTEIPSSEEYFLIREEKADAAKEQLSRPLRKSASTSATATIPVTAEEKKPETGVNETAAETSAHPSDDRDRDITSTTKIRITAAKAAAATQPAQAQTTAAPAGNAVKAETTHPAQETTQTKVTLAGVKAASRSSGEKTAATSTHNQSTTATAPKPATTSAQKSTMSAQANTTTTRAAVKTTHKSYNEPDSVTEKETKAESTTSSAPHEAQTQAPKRGTAEINITITQGGEYADSISLTVSEGDEFTFADAKSAVEAKGYDTAFAEYSGVRLPLTVEKDKAYNLTVDVE